VSLQLDIAVEDFADCDFEPVVVVGALGRLVVVVVAALGLVVVDAVGDVLAEQDSGFD
jgi:hypothetical protein